MLNRISRFVLTVILLGIGAFGVIVLVGLLFGFRSVGEFSFPFMGAGLLLILWGAGGPLSGGRVMGGLPGTAETSDYAHLKTANAKALQSSRSRLDRAWDFLEAFQIALVGVIMAIVGLVIGG